MHSETRSLWGFSTLIVGILGPYAALRLDPDDVFFLLVFRPLPLPLPLPLLLLLLVFLIFLALLDRFELA